ncbi:tripartite tricarboxylate transporter substrate-binding protein [Alicyclobacillus fastidiosus]|uniref:Tripartite tricarboxylate transporter substrate-binding protein n=2 Tax=Alicyclobacillus fastidiosus TaxID=392011 RepID=A0ABY6ZBK9_9BACL|nr:tripartite tricarboxylate transporter substrate-binding protein [Alicyclobacillus fastidiosus]WAH40120.1 tripartite tricarboxylate transporter substrate-binding protein [Alicyclobacillus fastidiosus]
MNFTVKRFALGAVFAVTLATLASGCGTASQASSTASSATASSPATGQSAAAFFRGKTMQLIVPYGPGGGYDQWARLIAPYLQKYLDLKQVEVVNAPGGGGLVGTNEVYAAKPDGLTIGDTNAGGDVFDQMVGASGMTFDVTKMTWLARPDDDPHVIAVHPSGPYQSFADLEKAKQPVKALATGKGSSDYNAAVIAFNAFHIPFDMVAAFSGSSDEKAAFLRGDGDTTSLSASDIAQTGGKAKVVVLQSDQSFDKLPGVPTIVDLAQQAGLSANAIDGLKAMANIMDLGHAFIAPPGVPADRVQALDHAMSQSLQDPSFVAAAQKAHLYVGYLSGSQLTNMVQEAMNNTNLLKPLLDDQK